MPRFPSGSCNPGKLFPAEVGRRGLRNTPDSLNPIHVDQSGHALRIYESVNSMIQDADADQSLSNGLELCESALKVKLLHWMRGGGGCFDETALEVFAYQYSKNAPYRRYCDALGRSPGTIESWHEIPAVPTDVFKLPGIGLRCFPGNEIGGFFLTSGTTSEVKGKHEWRDLELYEAAVKGGWGELGLPEMDGQFYFSQRMDAAPHSSLVRMFEMLDQGGEWLIDADGRMDVGGFFPQAPAAILGTSLALLRACEEMEAITLPKGSWIFETGGSKGIRKSFSPDEVRERLSRHFGVPLSRILNEYGMTELFSQFYKWGDEITHKGPPWVGVRVVDVATGLLATDGQIGYLEIVDLANLETISAIRTQDLAVKIGDREFRLMGRDPGALARGCSRGIDYILGA